MTPCALFLLLCSLSVTFPKYQCILLKKESTPSVLFASGNDALSWDSDELTRVRFLHLRSFDDPDYYQKSNDLANYLGLTPIGALHLPVPLNIIPIGFNNDGNKGIKLDPEELQEWFETIDHIVPHVRIPFSELSCKEDGHCVNLTQVHKPRPLHSYVHYNISVHAIEVESSLSRSFSSLVSELSRGLSFNNPRDANLQVDVTGLEGAIDGMLAELGLLWSYNVLLINPKRRGEGGYVYRAGLSEEEIDHFMADKKITRKVRTESDVFANRVPLYPGQNLLKNQWHPGRSTEKFDTQRLISQSTKWAQDIKKWIMDRQNVKSHLSHEFKPYLDLLPIKGIHADVGLRELLDLVRDNKDRSKMTGFNDMRVLEPEEGCLMDAWAGHHRWIMLDFSANAQDWGPFVGGDGIKTPNTLPSIERYFGKDPSIQDIVLKEKLLREKANVMNDLKPFQIGEEVPIDVLQSVELELFERFHDENCKSIERPPEICKKIDSALDQLRSRRVSFTTEDGLDLLARWLSNDNDDGTIGVQKDARMKDLFLAHTSALLSKAMRHVFLPPTISWQSGRNSLGWEHSKPFAKHVIFSIFMLADPEAKRSPFDVKLFKKELQSLKLENQDFSFSIQKEDLLGDHVLSSSLESSMRTVNLEQVGSEVSSGSEFRQYFDSEELQHLLDKHFILGKGTPPSNDPNHLEVPIFILSLNRAYPIFIDQHSVAKALDNMVIVVQNSQYRWQHPLGISCGGSITGHSLAAPLKAALAATLQHLGGLLPPHLGYSPSHHAITHDWSWSIGANPLSLTSPGWKISQAQIDAVHRSYLLDAIDISIEEINQGIYTLQAILPSERAFEVIQKESKQLKTLLRIFPEVVDLWREMVKDMGQMEFRQATNKIERLRSKSGEFMFMAGELAQDLHPLKCMPPSRIMLGLNWLTEEVIGGCLFVAVGIIVYMVMPKKRKKKSF